MPHRDADDSSYLHSGPKCAKMANMGSQVSHFGQSRAKMQVSRTLGVVVQYKCAKSTWKSSKVSANSVQSGTACTQPPKRGLKASTEVPREAKSGPAASKEIPDGAKRTHVEPLLAHFGGTLGHSRPTLARFRRSCQFGRNTWFHRESRKNTKNGLKIS